MPKVLKLTSLTDSQYGELQALMALMSRFGLSINAAAQATGVPFSRINAAAARCTSERMGVPPTEKLLLTAGELLKLRQYLQEFSTLLAGVPVASVAEAASAPPVAAPRAKVVASSAAPVAATPARTGVARKVAAVIKPSAPKSTRTAKRAKVTVAPPAQVSAAPAKKGSPPAKKTAKKAPAATAGVPAPQLVASPPAVAEPQAVVRPEFLVKAGVSDEKFVALKERLILVTVSGKVPTVHVDVLADEFEVDKPVVRKIIDSDYLREQVRPLKELLAAANQA